MRDKRGLAIQIPAWIGQAFAVVFEISTFIFNPNLIMNAFGIFLGARQQAAIAKMAVSAPATP
jgi:hypothetical protein